MFKNLFTALYQISIYKTNLLQMIHGKPLHLHYLIIASTVIERVASVRKVLQHISRIKTWYPIAVHPGYPEKVIWKLNKHSIYEIILLTDAA